MSHANAGWFVAYCELEERIEALNEGSEPCRSCQHCDGRGLVEKAGDECAFCQEIDYGVWEAGEPE